MNIGALDGIRRDFPYVTISSSGSAFSNIKKDEGFDFSKNIEFSKIDQLKQEIISKYNVNLNPPASDGSFNNLYISEAALEKMVNDPGYKKKIMDIVDTFPRFLQETQVSHALVGPAKGAYMRIEDDGSYVRHADLADEEMAESGDVLELLYNSNNRAENYAPTDKPAEYAVDYSQYLAALAPVGKRGK